MRLNLFIIWKKLKIILYLSNNLKLNSDKTNIDEFDWECLLDYTGKA
jgi:hypothetical protein